jgi:hypothetical protein
LSPGYFNTVEEIEQTIQAMERITKTKPPQAVAKNYYPSNTR